MTPQKPLPLWIVVQVESGIPVLAEPFYNMESAQEREQFLRMHMNLENDETGIFEIQIQSSVRRPEPRWR
jgi:hypothetical protein